MSKRTVRIDRPLPSHTRGDGCDWCTWLARHGLPDATRIPVTSDIVCDDTNRTITVETYVLNEQGWMITDDAIRDSITVQLEARALSIPDGYVVLHENDERQHLTFNDKTMDLVLGGHGG